MTITLEVNGERYDVDARRPPAARRAARRPRAARHEARLRRGRLRRLRGARRRPAGQRLPPPRRGRLRPRDRDDRGAVDGSRASVQEAFVAEDALQCGFCTPGQIVSATALLERVPHPSASRSTRRWPGTSAAVAPIRRSSARSCAPRVTHDRPLRAHAEGDGGPVRGRLGTRRRGRRRRVLGRGCGAVARRAAGAAP